MKAEPSCLSSIFIAGWKGDVEGEWEGCDGEPARCADSQALLELLEVFYVVPVEAFDAFPGKHTAQNFLHLLRPEAFL